MVASDQHLVHIRGITREALRQGHTVAIFATDEGTRLLADSAFFSLSELPGVSISYCEHSARHHGGRPGGLPGAIVAGSQFENALMTAESDKVIVL